MSKWLKLLFPQQSCSTSRTQLSTAQDGTEICSLLFSWSLNINIWFSVVKDSLLLTVVVVWLVREAEAERAVSQWSRLRHTVGAGSQFLEANRRLLFWHGSPCIAPGAVYRLFLLDSYMCDMCCVYVHVCYLFVSGENNEWWQWGRAPNRLCLSPNSDGNLIIQPTSCCCHRRQTHTNTNHKSGRTHTGEGWRDDRGESE